MDAPTNSIKIFAGNAHMELAKLIARLTFIYIFIIFILIYIKLLFDYKRLCNIYFCLKV